MLAGPIAAVGPHQSPLFSVSHGTLQPGLCDDFPNFLVSYCVRSMGWRYCAQPTAFRPLLHKKCTRVKLRDLLSGFPSDCGTWMQRSDPSGACVRRCSMNLLSTFSKTPNSGMCSVLSSSCIIGKPKSLGWSVTAVSCWGRAKTYIYPLPTTSNCQPPSQPRQSFSTGHHVFNYFGTSRSILPGGLFG